MAAAVTPCIVLCGQVRLMQGELARLSLLWEEAWHATLSELQVMVAWWISIRCRFVEDQSTAAFFGFPCDAVPSGTVDSEKSAQQPLLAHHSCAASMVQGAAIDCLALLLRRRMCRGGWWRCRRRRPAWRSAPT